MLVLYPIEIKLLIEYVHDDYRTSNTKEIELLFFLFRPIILTILNLTKIVSRSCIANTKSSKSVRSTQETTMVTN